MRLFVPPLGTQLRLLADWTFPLHNEHRNTCFQALAEPSTRRVGVNHDLCGYSIDRYETARDQFDMVQANDPAAEYRIEEEVTVRRWSGSWPAERCMVDVPGVRYSCLQVSYPDVVEVTLPAGDLLTVDRIYIRKGVSGFDSVTFGLKQSSHPALAKVKRRRFWAKLADVNSIEAEVVSK